MPETNRSPQNRFKYTCHHDAATRTKTIKDQHVMLRINKILERKATKAQLHEISLNAFGLKEKPSGSEKIVIPIEASVVVFVEDGADINTCRCFRYNLAEIIDKFKTTAPNTGATSVADFNA